MLRSRGITALAIVAATGGVLGILAGMWLPTAKIGSGGRGLVVGLVVLVLSVIEFAFAYGAWTLTPWALKPGPRAIGFAVAIALILVGLFVSYSIPVPPTLRVET